MSEYCYSFDEEIFHGVGLTTRADAVAEGFASDEEATQLWVGKSVKVSAADLVSGYSILDSIAEQAYDQVGEHSEDWGSVLLGDKALEAAIETAVIAVLTEKAPHIAFYRVEEVELVFRS